MSDIEQRLRGENPEHCVVTDRLRANIGMPDTFQFNRDDAVELDELVLEAADELARLKADNASLRSKLEEAEGALEFYQNGFRFHPKRSPLGVDLSEWKPTGSLLEDCGETARRTLSALREADHA